MSSDSIPEDTKDHWFVTAAYAEKLKENVMFTIKKFAQDQSCNNSYITWVVILVTMQPLLR